MDIANSHDSTCRSPHAVPIPADRQEPQHSLGRYRCRMSTILHLIIMWLASALAAVRTTFRRLLLGPTVASWTWKTEWFVAIARATIRVAADKQDDMVVSLFGRLIRTPVPPSLSSKVRVRRSKLGRLTTDRYTYLNDSSTQLAMLYFHGGGYVFGNPGTHRQHIARLVNATHATAFAPQYRLAPQNPFPAAVDDGIAAYQAMLDDGIDPATIFVCGDSAGGGLALATVLRARDNGLPLPGGMVLFSPYTDLTHSGYTIALNAGTDYLPLAQLSEPNTYYAPGFELTNPEVSPVFADLTGFPPILTFAGGCEMILDDAVRLHSRARKAEVDSTLIVEQDMMHVWPAVVPWEPAAARTLRACSQWVSEKI